MALHRSASPSARASLCPPMPGSAAPRAIVRRRPPRSCRAPLTRSTVPPLFTLLPFCPLSQVFLPFLPTPPALRRRESALGRLIASTPPCPPLRARSVCGPPLLFASRPTFPPPASTPLQFFPLPRAAPLRASRVHAPSQRSFAPLRRARPTFSLNGPGPPQMNCLPIWIGFPLRRCADARPRRVSLGSVGTNMTTTGSPRSSWPSASGSSPRPCRLALPSISRHSCSNSRTRRLTRPWLTRC